MGEDRQRESAETTATGGGTGGGGGGIPGARTVAHRKALGYRGLHPFPCPTGPARGGRGSLPPHALGPVSLRLGRAACSRHSPSVPTGRRASTPRLLAGRRSSRSPLATAALGALRPCRPPRPRCPGSERAAAPLALRRSPQPSTPRLPAGRHCSRSPPPAAALGLRWPSRPSTPGLPASHRGSHSPPAAAALDALGPRRPPFCSSDAAPYGMQGSRREEQGGGSRDGRGARVFFLSV
ncbi:hypothetical protein PVAP13_2NG455003 [Panicum virgatum]|uniref:Uncharacterized protein n=1 Tax=Panicum virgatum TaxID=38727 RepID=A0A8T0VNS5_PANVG|nr:hypothetical protein PVAP13_2NG455003 [Panicum virgatum]